MLQNQRKAAQANQAGTKESNRSEITSMKKFAASKQSGVVQSGERDWSNLVDYWG